MKVGDMVLHKGLKAEIINIKYGLICIRYKTDSVKNWVNPESLKKL